MGKESITTEVKLAGEHDRVQNFLKGKEITDATIDDNGHFLIGVFSDGEKNDSPFGKIGVDYELVKTTTGTNCLVVLDCSDATLLHAKKTTRKIPVNREGIGSQQLRNGVDLLVQTNAPVAVFEKKRR